MTFAQRLEAVVRAMRDAGLDRVVGLHDGAHFIEKPNPVMLLTGFKAIGPSAVVVNADGTRVLVVTPARDAGRAGETGLPVIAADTLAEGLSAALAGRAGRTGTVGASALPSALLAELLALMPDVTEADALVFDAAARKTDGEIADARMATQIAEATLAHMVEIIRPGQAEDDLAIELRQFSREQGAEDNFLLLCAAPHPAAVAPPNGRRLKRGDIVIVEISPSYRGQMVQICRTLVLGQADPVLADRYALVVQAMHSGFAAARPGATVAQVCAAIDAVLEAEGYAEYCRPPHIRRRGHGLGFASIRPGDVARDNDTVLEPDMLFMIHPNQYLPERGYMLCGEPALVTATGAVALTRQTSALIEIAV